MKISKTLLAALFPVLALGSPEEDNFTKIELNSVGKVYITQGDANYVEINSSGSKEGIETSVRNNTLYIDSKVDAEYKITMRSVEALAVGGTGEISSNGTISSDHIKLDVSGSGKMNLALQVKDLDIDISGVGKIALTGKADNANISISGSGKVDAFDLAVKNCTAEISGVGKCSIDVTDSLRSEISGMGTVNYKTKPAHINTEVSGVGRVNDEAIVGGTEKSDTTHLSFGDAKVLIVRSDSTISRRKEKQERSKPIWQGLELGFNNYLNDDMKIQAPDGYEYLELNTGKSVAVGLNLIQQNFRMGKSNFWFFTGLGLTWNNYRFDKNVLLNTSSGVLSGGYDTSSSRNYSKSKLTTLYVTAPLMFEFFTDKKIKKAFHVGLGAMLGYRIGSHTKQKFVEDSDTEKAKQFDDFYLNAFRYGARFAIGYRKWNVFADYSISELFRNNKGPQLNPVTIGINVAAF
jgi:hypothetical protein